MSKKLQIQGVNRGGKQFWRQLQPHLRGCETDVQLEAWDLREDRAEDFSNAARRLGVDARWGIGTPPDSGGIDFKGTFIDDPREIARELERASLAHVHATGILAESRWVPGLGGELAGYGMVRTSDSSEVESQGRQLFATIAEAAGNQRTTSREISDLPTNTSQLNTVRQRTHSVFANSAAGVIKDIAASPQIFTVSRRTPHAYPSVVVEAPSRMSRREQRLATVEDILPQFGEDVERGGVTFVRRDEPSLFTILGSRRGAGWREDQVIELPVETPERRSFVVPSARPRRARPQQEGSAVARAVRLLVTD